MIKLLLQFWTSLAGEPDTIELSMSLEIHWNARHNSHHWILNKLFDLKKIRASEIFNIKNRPSIYL